MKEREAVKAQLLAWMTEHLGVISLAEVRAIGAPYSMVRARLKRVEWDSPYPGVYRSTSAPRTGQQDLRAACLATRGAASDASAAWAWAMLDEMPSPIEVRIPRRSCPTRRKLGVVVHQSRDLSPGDVMIHDGVPVTKPLRTLLDLAATGTKDQLTEAVDKALATRLVTISGLMAAVSRRSKRRRPGVGLLREHLAVQGFLNAPEPSVLEARLRRLVRQFGRPLPEVEIIAGKGGQYRLDAGWAEIALAVEVDGYTWHYSPRHKRRDELRRQELREAGWTVLVFDWFQLTRQSTQVARKIKATYDRLVSQRRDGCREQSH